MLTLDTFRELADASGFFVAGGPDRVLVSCPVPGCNDGTLTASENGRGLIVTCTSGCDLDAILEAFDARTDSNHAAGLWLEGAAMDPAAVTAEPLPAIPGFPFLHAGVGALISGPTGGGRSSLVEACAYDAARQGVRVAYLGSEVTEGEFNARAADLAERRGDHVDDQLREDLARVRYLNLASVIARAWQHPDQWAAAVADRFDVVLIDPQSSVAAVLNLDFDKSNAEFVRFYDRLVQPLATAGVAVVLLENIGHAVEARGRAKGVSAKQDRADLTFSCKLRAQPVGLMLTASKVRSVRAGFRRGDSWTFDRETQRITPGSGDAHDSEPTFRPTELMERVSRALEAGPALTRNGVRAAVKGKRATYVDLALQVLVAEGYVIAEQDGQAKRHRSLKPYRVPESLPSPNRVPDPVRGTGSPSPALKDSGPGTRSTDMANRVPPVDDDLEARADGLAERYPEATA